MFETVEIPVWALWVAGALAVVGALDRVLIPSVRWYFRRRLQRAVARLNQRLARPIEPFKLARRHDMIQRLIYDPEVAREIVIYARENDVPENVAFQKARSYAREIVPSFSAFAYFGFGIRLARLLVNALYSVRTGPGNEAVLHGIPQRATVIFVMNHRSNMDYVLVTYLAGRMSALSYAVGEWARVWPLSLLIKSMGAYFIRRKSRGGLYRKVLARYVQMATAGGVAQAMFPEGGLSLTGKVAEPKLGLLSYLMEGYDPEGRDIVFVPVAINYDRILEDNVLIAAAARGDRRFGARITVVVGYMLRKAWQAVRGRYSRFGAAAVVFGRPLSLREFGPDRPVSALASTLMDRIEAEMPVLFVPLIARILQQAGAPMTASALSQEVTAEAAALDRHFLGGPKEAYADGMALALSKMVRNGLIRQTAAGWEAVPGQEAKLAFYANSIAHHFTRDAAAAQ